MKSAGVDVGSRSIELVLLEDGEVTLSRVAETTHDPISACRRLLSGVEYDRLVASGYGRHLLRQYWDCEVITEIKAVGLGARAVLPAPTS